MPHNKIKNAFFDLDAHIYTDAILQPVHPPLILSGGDSYEMYRDKSQKELIPIRNKRQYPRLRTAHFGKPRCFEAWKNQESWIKGPKGPFYSREQ